MKNVIKMHNDKIAPNKIFSTIGIIFVLYWSFGLAVSLMAIAGLGYIIFHFICKLW